MIYVKSVVASAILCVALVGCGGGGGGDSSSDQSVVPSVNVAPKPVITSDAKNTFFDTQELKFSAEKSNDENKDALTYRWQIKSKPTRSKTAIKLSNQVDVSFTPDMVGDYVLSLTVSDGKLKETKDFSFTVTPKIEAYQLTFKPKILEYNQVANILVGFDDETDILHIVNGNDATNASIPLEDDIQRLKISPNGKYALTLHANHISFIDLEKQKLVKSYPNDGPYSDLFITDQKIGYVVGQENGRSWQKGVVKLNLETGKSEEQLVDQSYAIGDIEGIYSAKRNKFLFLEFGISPQDLNQIILDKSGNGVGIKDSPYHGDYEFGDALFLDYSENYVYASSGNYFNANNLNYAGRLKITPEEKIHRLIDIPHLQKLISINAPLDYSNSLITRYYPYYYEYSGLAYAKVNKVDLPTIKNQQAYALNTFLDNQDNLTMIVQIGSDNPNAANLEYYWLDYGNK